MLGPDVFDKVIAVSFGSGVFDDEMMAHLNALPDMDRLYLGSQETPKLTSEGIASFRSLRGRLDTFVVSGDANPFIPELKDMGRLDSLILWRPVSDADLAKISGLSSLEFLSIDGSRLTAEGLMQLAASPKFKDLELRNPSPALTSDVTNRLLSARPGLKYFVR